MLVTVSDDGGETWSESTTIVGPRPGEFAEAVITTEGIRVYQGKLIAYYGIYEYTTAGLLDGHRHLEGKANAPLDVAWHRDTRTEIVVSEDGGNNWSKPVAAIPRFLPNLSPAPIRGGRLIIPGNLLYPFTEDPEGLNGWKTAGVPRLSQDYVDDPEGFRKGCKLRGDSTHYCEGSFFQTDDGSFT